MQKRLIALLVMISSMATAQETGQIFSVSAPKDKTGQWTRIQQFNLESSTNQRPIIGARNEEVLAACAYASKQDRLYYSPMLQNQLRYIEAGDSKTGPKIFYGPELIAGADMKQVGNQITRMTVDGKGNGYALNNDATHLVRFNTSGSWLVQDLGVISDVAANGANTIHNPCLSWGGDMAADINGNLLLVTSNRAVFTIDVASKLATFKGMIKGLPVNYTTNGVAADENGQLIVGSATSSEGYFQVNLKTLEATAVKSSLNSSEHVSDLASPFLLNQSKSTLARSEKTLPVNNGSMTIYPNPITDGRVRVTLEGLKAGRYELQLFDLNGAMVSRQQINLSSKYQVEQMQAAGTVTKGVYLVKLIGKNSRIFFADKLIVQ